MDRSQNEKKLICTSCKITYRLLKNQGWSENAEERCDYGITHPLSTQYTGKIRIEKGGPVA